VKRRAATAAGLLLLVAAAGCTASAPRPDTASIPPWAAPFWQGDIIAILHAEWAWADPSRTHGLPAQGALAVAEIDYLAGDLSTSPRWVGLSPLATMRMVQARAAVRQVVGIAPDASSQAVVDALLATKAALDAGNRPAALAALSGPIFGFGPERTLAVLGALPYVQTANIATALTAQAPQLS
jgi:hypothetical protein